jgi:hypothetical protein
MVHLIVPFAAPGSDAGRQALASLALPGLGALLARCGAATRDDGDELSLSPPHERALARAFGWAGGDGALPLAAWLATSDGIAPGDLAWGLLTPAHWHLGTEQVSLIDPAQLALDEAGSRALFDTVKPLFTSEGIVLHWGAPLRWYAAHESLAGLRCASPDRVIGRNVDPWLPIDPAARLFRRLQNEVQMLLHEHPLNERRQAQGLLPVNSFWLSGCGVAQPVAGPAPRVEERLRRAALGEDWAAWVKAWDVLDAELAVAPPATLTLCGERSAACFERTPPGVMQRLRTLFHRAAPRELLGTL